MPENKYQELKLYVERLENRIRELEQKKEPIKQLEIKPFEDIKFYPKLKVNDLIIKYLETTTTNEPAIFSNQIILWKDTTLTKYYLKANFNGTAKKIELV